MVKSLGKTGEAIAKEYFESLGFEVVAENYRYNRAETDLVVKDEKKRVLVFVEVKTRRNRNFGEPQESVTPKKQQQMVKSAEGFLMMTPGYEDYEKRFDVAAIMIEDGKAKLDHIENCF
ncbi:MAG TPA: YraN family protein [Ignavibacteria bacterium]|nr:YraN family protein [Bacteroidota bacterium]HRE09287.1 YraN family protein [Ignavibacteria bacterium]HRF66248.1 YraN family protein [Ignavibacteria bacterium]HRJ03806.1 YraN family protein [Ignavibacteria bacterium]HRJ86658.1 YraN family protein [Ignavibacteria bacterium]